LTAYQGFLRDLRDSHPGDRLAIDAINNHVAAGALYKALKEIRKLMKREDALLAARSASTLPRAADAFAARP
jgi:flagellar protein FlbT